MLQFLLFITFLSIVFSYSNKYITINKFQSKLITSNSKSYQKSEIPRFEFGLNRFLSTTSIISTNTNTNNKNLIKTINYDDIQFINPLQYHKQYHNMNNNIVYYLTKNWNNLLYKSKSFLSSLLLSCNLYILPNIKKLTILTTSIMSCISLVPTITKASILKSYNKLSPIQKLATTPLFYICNQGGNPYLQDDLQSGNPEQRIVVYFMSSEDAQEYLNEIAQGSPGNINEFRIMTTSMEKIVTKIQSRKQSRKLGRYPMNLIYRIQPSSKQCENAEFICGNGDMKKGSQILNGISVPMFSIKGMGMKRSNGELVTPYYFAYEDLLEDWERVIKTSNEDMDIPLKPDVSYINLLVLV